MTYYACSASVFFKAALFTSDFVISIIIVIISEYATFDIY